MPVYATENFKRWQELHPNWQVRLWTNSDLTSENVDPAVLERIGVATEGAQKADILRYYAIRRFGGVYVDSDIVPHRSLAGVIREGNLVVCHDLPVTWGYIINAFFAASPAHPVITNCLEMALRAKLNTPDIHMTTGPRVLGEAVSQWDKNKVVLLEIEALYRNANVALRLGTHTYAHEWKGANS